MKDIAIFSAKRTPIGSFLGSLSAVEAPKLGAHAIKGALNDIQARPEWVDETILGEVLTAGVGQAPARQAAIFAGIPDGKPALTINKVCGSGMQAILLGAQSIALGDSKCVVVGGQENMSRAPFLLTAARNGFRLGHQQSLDSMIHDGLWDPYNNKHMGNCGETCAREYGFTREAQDQYAKESFEFALAAQKSGAFDSEIFSYEQVTSDEGPAKVKFEKIPTLKPAFDKQGTITAANASTLNDGAAALVLGHASMATQLGAKPMAWIKGYGRFAQNPEWFTTAPIPAMKQAMDRAGWAAKDVDLFEVNEAFAVVAMAAMKDLSIERSRMNVNGGAISLGHPIGASGARIVVTLLHALKQRGLKRGVAGICIGGGEGFALAVEIA